MSFEKYKKDDSNSDCNNNCGKWNFSALYCSNVFGTLIYCLYNIFSYSIYGYSIFRLIIYFFTILSYSIFRLINFFRSNRRSLINYFFSIFSYSILRLINYFSSIRRRRYLGYWMSPFKSIPIFKAEKNSECILCFKLWLILSRSLTFSK